MGLLATSAQARVDVGAPRAPSLGSPPHRQRPQHSGNQTRRRGEALVEESTTIEAKDYISCIDYDVWIMVKVLTGG